MLTVFGTMALDTTRTPFRVEEKILGGAATFAALSAATFAKTGMVAAIGEDMPLVNIEAVGAKGVDTKGIVTIRGGKCFHYDSEFDYNLSSRTTLKTELNVIADFDPVIPEEYANSEYVYLANNDPRQNMKILSHFEKPKLVVCDTIEYWIKTARDDVIKMIGKTDGVVINESEARLLCNEVNIAKCSRQILSFGPMFTIIKKGEHGAVLFTQRGEVFPATAFFLDEISDPTGAGDSFAGGFLGHIARIGKTDFRTMKEAVIFGNVMGSFAVEDFGVRRLLAITKDDIDERYQKYRNLVQF